MSWRNFQAAFTLFFFAQASAHKQMTRHARSVTLTTLNRTQRSVFPLRLTCESVIVSPNKGVASYWNDSTMITFSCYVQEELDVYL